MMFCDPFQGNSLFAKMLNAYALQLPPIVGHRNRITYLLEKLAGESLRILTNRRDMRVFNLGCGPAQEIQRFLASNELSNQALFTLADFNKETLDYTGRLLAELKERHHRQTTIQMVRRSVQQMLKSAERDIEYAPSDQFDLVYCAGLFDYLTDQVCRQLMKVFYEMLAPGGLLIVTNVDNHPARHQMECFLDWHLVYRNADRMRLIIPPKASAHEVLIKYDPSAVNIFMEIRKPASE